MAFYTTRIDNDGNELDILSVSSSRTVVPQAYFSEIEEDVQTMRTLVPQSFVDHGDHGDHGDNCSSELDDCSTIYDNESPRYIDDFGMVSASGNTTLREKYDDGQCYSDEEEMDDIVPPLDLRSELNLSIQNIPTFSCHKAKLIHTAESKSNQPYEMWLAKKLEAQLAEAARRKKEEERRKQEQDERKRLAEEKYQSWLAKKRQASNPTKNQQFTFKRMRSSSSSSSTSTTSASSGSSASSLKSANSAKSPPTSATSSLSSASSVLSDKQRKIEEWERAKLKQLEERRLREKKQAEERARIEAKRKEESDAAFKHWVQRNKNRPKPVPMNQGILSLRGTISDIYINPNEWKSILD